MLYQEALDRIHDFGKFGSKLGLQRMAILMAKLGNPQDQIKTIHVAGTNGKGSVCRYIYSILLEGGYRAGLYTSPFLERFTERFEFNGSEISEADLAYFAEKVLLMADIMVSEGEESPTEFEVITAIGFCYFADQKADFLVLEVGLGGAGDSTNIIKEPEVSVITSISYDHMDYLGDTLEKIAAEKAGIIKQNVPVISYVADTGAKSVIKAIAEEKNAEFHDAASCPWETTAEGIFQTNFDVQIGEKKYKGVEISMIGRHQIENAICALSVIEVLKNKKSVTLIDQQVYNGIKRARHTGRLEILGENPFLIIDGAHNEAGAAALAAVMRAQFKGKRTLLVLGILKDKKAAEIFAQLMDIAEDLIATEPDNPRKMDAKDLADIISASGKSCIVLPSISDVLDYVEKNQKKYDVVLFAGSLYLIGKVRSMRHEKTQGTIHL